MTDARLAIVGLGSVGSMALWQASKLSESIVGFDSHAPAHPRSAVGGDSRLFRMTYRDDNHYYPILQESESLWRELEAESGHEILTQCGGLSIGASDGPYIPALLTSIGRTDAPHRVLSRAEMAETYPQHNLREGECAILDPRAGFLRTDRAVTAAIDVARANGATVMSNTAIDEIREAPDGVILSSGANSWKFDRVIVASGSWSKRLLPQPLRAEVKPRRIFLSWFVARDASQFAPERFPIFIRISGNRSLYGTPSLDQVTVKATLDGRSAATLDPNALARDLTLAEVAESVETVTEFLPDLIPNIVRSDAYPDLYTADGAALLGAMPQSQRIYYATGFSGTGFKMATGFGAIAASEALGRRHNHGIDFLRPARFSAA